MYFFNQKILNCVEILVVLVVNSINKYLRRTLSQLDLLPILVDH